jgi:hypothetical protein
MNDPDKDLASVKDEDWLTDELQQEIMSHYYPQSKNGISGVMISRDAKADNSFQKHALECFPSGCKFASYVQLWGAVKLFLKAWRVPLVLTEDNVIMMM